MSTATVTPTDVLQELEPLVGSVLDRHLTAAQEWFPHEYVPWEQGRSFTDSPWELGDRFASIIITPQEQVMRLFFFLRV